tara:strand:+ start:442 stop:630 length:189 start_codon:yes stop_codon:yes gene_type:complete
LIAMMIYFYGMSFKETLELSLPQMQGLMEEMPKVFKMFSAAGGTGAAKAQGRSKYETMGAMR